MTHNFTLFLLNKIHARSHMSEDEYENVAYSLELLFINIFKSIQVYVVAFLLGVIFETFVMNLAYVLLRWQAGGWHAKSSLNCSLFGLLSFVGIPLIFQHTGFILNSNWSLILALFVLFNTVLYAPADTEKNPLVSVSERKKKKILATCTAFALVIIAMFFVKNDIRTLLLTGLFVEIIMIHPLFYKINKRSYKNYEKYQVQP